MSTDSTNDMAPNSLFSMALWEIIAWAENRGLTEMETTTILETTAETYDGSITSTLGLPDDHSMGDMEHLMEITND